MLDKFAEELKEARLKSGITLQQMSTRTRIDIKFLEAIDNGDFIFLPEPYVKAFLKDYARIVGLDENKTIQKFEAAKKGKLIEEVPKLREEEPDKQEGKTGEPDKPEVKSASSQVYDAAPSETTANTSPDMTRRNIILGSIIGGSILVLGLIYLVFLRNGSEIIVAEKPIEEVIEDNQQRYVDEESGLDTAGGGQMISPDSISLTILSEDTTWIRIIFDENRSEEFILFPNSQKIVRTKNNYKITIGNPSGIKFQLNNKPLNFTWGKGTVASILIDSSGLQYLKTVPVRKQPAVEVDSSNIQ
jgi:hypothetical protein